MSAHPRFSSPSTSPQTKSLSSASLASGSPAGTAPRSLPALPGEPALAALLERVAVGQQAALEQLFDATHRAVHALALRLVGDVAAAEEITLDVFMQVWRQAGRFEPWRGAVGAWLMTIARSRALDHRRARAVRAGWEQARGLEDSDLASTRGACAAGGAGVSHDPFAICAGREQAARLSAALAALDADHRSVIQLAFLDGCSHGEIAARAGLPLGTVKSRIRRGLLRLEQALSEAGRAS